MYGRTVVWLSPVCHFMPACYDGLAHWEVVCRSHKLGHGSQTLFDEASAPQVLDKVVMALVWTWLSKGLGICSHPQPMPQATACIPTRDTAHLLSGCQSSWRLQDLQPNFSHCRPACRACLWSQQQQIMALHLQAARQTPCKTQSLRCAHDIYMLMILHLLLSFSA